MSKKEQTQQNIIDAFWELYETTRIEKITVKNVCAKANINRSTFYEYFKDVYEILEIIEESIIPSPSNLPYYDTEHKVIDLDMKSKLDYFNANKKYLKVLLSENGNPAFRFKLINSIKPMILNLMKDKEKPENFEYILEYHLWGMIGILSYHINNETGVSDQSVIKTIMDISAIL